MDLPKRFARRGIVLYLQIAAAVVSMGVLLAVMLAYALFCTLLVLPALLGPPPKEVPAPRKSGLD